MLATSMHAQPGVYALLLGSGVSSGAGIATGWGVVTTLVREVAALVDLETDKDNAATGDGRTEVEKATADPEQWWSDRYGTELGYSTLLEELAPTPAVRQGRLAKFFEPTDEERAEGIKTPSAAHHAVADLVRRGFIRVILTTNFDRLMEQALEAAGISPQVISRPQAVQGMAPLAHAPATVIKLHGDYKDLDSLNTADELATYPQPWTQLLHQVLDEYGLVISGWSAQWDTALVSTIEESPSRRYPLYWDSRSSRGDTAKRLLAHRHGHVIPAPGGADQLFSELSDNVDALERLAQPPLTTAMATARLKRYLPNPVHRIDLHDLLLGTAEHVAQAIAEQPLNPPRIDGETIESLWNTHLEAVAPLTQLLVTGIWHDSDGEHTGLWIDTLQRLVDAGTAPINSAITGFDNARLWPALIAFTAAGVTATHRRHDRTLIGLAENVQGRGQMGTGKQEPAAHLLHPHRILESNWVLNMPRWHGTPWNYPASHLLKNDLRRFFDESIPNEATYTQAFHGYEYRIGLIQQHLQHPDGYSLPAQAGEFVGERGWTREGIPHAETEFLRAIERDPTWWDYLVEQPEDLEGHLAAHREVLARYQRRG